MKFSVLLPTRNGALYLENCIRSILEQDHDDFELVISDNANTDGTSEIIQSFADDCRLKVVHQEELLSVSDNWTAALKASCGDYILMMGDDDYLMEGALHRLEKAILRHGEPDCILYNGYSYVSPNAIAGNRASYWAREHYNFGSGFDSEGVLGKDQRQSIVFDMFRFHQRIPLNMQTTLFARRTVERISGSVFRAPFPDHYLLNAMLIEADSWIYLPEQLVVVGVSPKSFGHFFYSQKSNDGLSYLGINTDFPDSLPGGALLNGMYSWLLDLKAHYPNELTGVEIDRAGYVRRQVYSWVQQRRHNGITRAELLSRFGMISFRDWIHLLTMIFDWKIWQRLARLMKIEKKSQAETLWNSLEPLDGVNNIREFAEWIYQHRGKQLE